MKEPKNLAENATPPDSPAAIRSSREAHAMALRAQLSQRRRTRSWLAWLAFATVVALLVLAAMNAGNGTNGSNLPASSSPPSRPASSGP
ncbi:MAG TPA: hypothetical protein VNO21_02050 [Polyangiaceae bacterium]|nr:hypothetical protein [Polyangiaceae bacterium]